jgi:hypothetical protein
MNKTLIQYPTNYNITLKVINLSEYLINIGNNVQNRRK